VLFDHLGLPALRKTPSGQPSTAEDVLEELAETYTLPRLILEHRSLSKLKSTYTDNLPKQINARTGPRAHLVSPGGRGDGPPVVGGSQPAEHSRAHGRGSAHPQAFVAPPGLRAARRRLLADRVAHHGASLRRRRAAQGVRQRQRRSSCDRSRR
jgi:DNA polymerase-1